MCRLTWQPVATVGLEKARRRGVKGAGPSWGPHQPYASLTTHTVVPGPRIHVPPTRNGVTTRPHRAASIATAPSPRTDASAPPRPRGGRRATAETNRNSGTSRPGRRAPYFRRFVTGSRVETSFHFGRNRAGTSWLGRWKKRLDFPFQSSRVVVSPHSPVISPSDFR